MESFCLEEFREMEIKARARDYSNETRLTRVVVTNEPPEDQSAQENNNNSRSETHNWLAGKRLWLKLDNPLELALSMMVAL